MTSPFYWALLGLVIKRPGYGYDLAKRFERDYGDVLPLSSPSHVYSGLDKLEGRGLIEPVPVEGSPSSRAGRQPRPGYRATEEGRQSYRAWLLTQVDESRRSWLLFVRLLGSLAPEPDAALEVIDRYRLMLLKHAPQPQRRRGRAEDAEPMDEVSSLVLRLTEEEERLAPGRMLEWADYAQGEFERLARKQP
jgi:DNA-binding PadR family transcriptional regulator